MAASSYSQDKHRQSFTDITFSQVIADYAKLTSELTTADIIPRCPHISDPRGLTKEKKVPESFHCRYQGTMDMGSCKWLITHYNRGPKNNLLVPLNSFAHGDELGDVSVTQNSSVNRAITNDGVATYWLLLKVSLPLKCESAEESRRCRQTGGWAGQLCCHCLTTQGCPGKVSLRVDDQN